MNEKTHATFFKMFKYIIDLSSRLILKNGHENIQSWCLKLMALYTKEYSVEGTR